MLYTSNLSRNSSVEPPQLHKKTEDPPPTIKRMDCVDIPTYWADILQERRQPISRLSSRGGKMSGVQRGKYYFKHLFKGSTEGSKSFDEFDRKLRNKFIELSESYSVKWTMTFKEELPDTETVKSEMNAQYYFRQSYFSVWVKKKTLCTSFAPKLTFPQPTH